MYNNRNTHKSSLIPVENNESKGFLNMLRLKHYARIMANSIPSRRLKSLTVQNLEMIGDKAHRVNADLREDEERASDGEEEDFTNNLDQN